jgi:hypothetical protein
MESEDPFLRAQINAPPGTYRIEVTIHLAGLTHDEYRSERIESLSVEASIQIPVDPNVRLIATSLYAALLSVAATLPLFVCALKGKI